MRDDAVFVSSVFELLMVGMMSESLQHPATLAPVEPGNLMSWAIGVKESPYSHTVLMPPFIHP